MPPRPLLDLQSVRREIQAAVLHALADADDVDAIVAGASPGDKRLDMLAGHAVLELATSALALAVPDGAEPLEYAGLRERFLPEISFSGRVQHRNSQYALYAAACRRGGLEPDVDNDAGWWGAPLWIYTTYALIIYSRSAAHRTGHTLQTLAQQLAEQHGVSDSRPDADARSPQE